MNKNFNKMMNMIPAGYEKKSLKAYDYNDSDYEDDDDDEFVFDFSEAKNKNKTFGDVTTNVEIEKSKVTFELSSQYYYEEMDRLLDDLKSAILQKNLTQVSSLIETHNIDVNCLFKTEWTPIMYAASCGSYELAEYLVNKGADVLYTEGDPIILI